MSGKNEKTYEQKISELLEQLPLCCQSFIYGRGTNTQSSTRYGYASDLNYFIHWLVQNNPRFVDKDIKLLTIQELASLSRDEMNIFIAHYHSTHSERSTARKRASISAFYEYFIADDKIQRNPAAICERVKVHQKMPIYLTNDEQDKLMDCILYGTGLSKKAQAENHKYVLRNYALVSLILDTGLRISEALNTRIRDFDFEECNVLVRRKGNKLEYVYYSDLACDHLQQYLNSKPEQQRKMDCPFFSTLSGDVLGVRAAENMVKKYACAALPQKGQSISPHKLRSSFAMSFYRASDNNLLLLQKRLSHADISTTNIYAKATNSEVKDSRDWRKLSNYKMTQMQSLNKKENADNDY